MDSNESAGVKSDGPRGKRKVLFLFVLFAIIAAIALLVPWLGDGGGVLIYSIFGIPREPVSPVVLNLEALGSRFITVGEPFSTRVGVAARAPINLVAATVHIPANLVSYRETRYDDSVINLWIRKPAVMERAEELKFAGGIQQDSGGFTGEGPVAAITLDVHRAGLGYVKLAEATVLAHDGKGTELPVGRPAITFLIREPNQPSPDLNDDGELSLSDVGVLLFRFAGAYDARYDINGDGKLDIADVQLLWLNLQQLQ